MTKSKLSINAQGAKVESKESTKKESIVKANEKAIESKVKDAIFFTKLEQFNDYSFSDIQKLHLSEMIQKEKHFFPKSFQGKEKDYRNKNRNVLKDILKSVIKGKFTDEKGKERLSNLRKFVLLKYGKDISKIDSKNFDKSLIYSNDIFKNELQIVIEAYQTIFKKEKE